MRSEEEAVYVEYISARLPRLHRTAYLLCGDTDRADDIVQLTAVAMYVHWGKVRAADSMDAYVHRMLVREFLNQQRLPWSRVLLVDRVPDRHVAEAATRFVERDVVLEALGRLPKGQRAAVVLRYFVDLSVEDTAAVLGCSEGNVKSQTSRGLATLREHLDSERGGPERGGPERGGPERDGPERGRHETKTTRYAHGSRSR